MGEPCVAVGASGAQGITEQVITHRVIADQEITDQMITTDQGHQ